MEGQGSSESEDIQLVIVKVVAGNPCIQKEVTAKCIDKDIMCNEITEDVPHLFFYCAFATRVWKNQQITGLDISSFERF